MSRGPRVALFADSFHEVNGAALTCRQLEAFAARRRYSFLVVCCGEKESMERRGPVWRMQLRRGKGALKVDRDLTIDPSLFVRRRTAVLEVVKEFQPDVVHIIGPGDLGALGAWVAHVTKAELVASWHTNLHEFAARRLQKMFRFLPAGCRDGIATAAERFVLDRVLWFYSRARVTFAPNRELVAMIADASKRPSFLMSRGIDTNLFTPERRDRTNGPFTLGFVGRLMPEKNVRFLAELRDALMAVSASPFRFLIVGDGSEAAWLRARMPDAEFAGILTGERLAQAYANMDVFVFPSETDTFGNVVLEALASGVPAIVTAEGGPKYLVASGTTGFVASTKEAFIACALELMRDRQLHMRMRLAARESVRQRSWDWVFEEQVYGAYRACTERTSPAAEVGEIRA
jgi:glycosyltransferase involved in cell wall biosynthesis